MRQERFNVVLERQNETYIGALTLQIEADGLSGCAEFSGSQNYFRGKVLRKNHYIFSLRLQVGAWTEDCDALLLAREDGTVSGVLLSPWHVWTLSGRRAEMAFA